MLKSIINGNAYTKTMIVWMIILSQTIKRKASITILLMIAANTNDNRNSIPILITDCYVMELLTNKHKMIVQS